MIYLISGPPKCGKTTLAIALSNTLGLPWISTDSLQNAIKPYIKSADFADIFPLSSMKYKNNDEKYNQHTISEIVKAYRKQASKIQPAIMAFIESEIADENDYIIEGYHVEPKFISEIQKKYPDNIKSLVLVNENVQEMINSFSKSKTPNDWVLMKTEKADTYKKIALMINEYSKQLLRDATALDLEIHSMDEDFEVKYQEALSKLSGPDINI